VDQPLRRDADSARRPRLRGGPSFVREMGSWSEGGEAVHVAVPRRQQGPQGRQQEVPDDHAEGDRDERATCGGAGAGVWLHGAGSRPAGGWPGRIRIGFWVGGAGSSCGAGEGASVAGDGAADAGRRTGVGCEQLLGVCGVVARTRSIGIFIARRRTCPVPGRVGFVEPERVWVKWPGGRAELITYATGCGIESGQHSGLGWRRHAAVKRIGQDG
jgi:hypothetical protein